MTLWRLHVTSGGRTLIIWNWAWSLRHWFCVLLLWLTIETIRISWSAQLVWSTRSLTHWIAFVLQFSASNIKLNTILINPSYRWFRRMIISGWIDLFVSLWILVCFFSCIIFFVSQFAVYTIQKVFLLILGQSFLISTGFHSRPLLVNDVDLSSSNVKIAVDFS